MRMRTTCAALAVVVASLAGCAVGPQAGPGLVIDDGPGGGPTSAVPAPPTPSRPTKDLDWGPCADASAPAEGVTLDCTTVDAQISTTSRAVMPVALTRARSTSTPEHAPPLLLTTGVDVAAGEGLRLFLGRSGRSLVDANPVVAVDRRGVGGSNGVDCLIAADRATLDSGGGTGTDDARITRTTAAGKNAAVTCGDLLAPFSSAYSPVDAARDLEAVRTAWGLDRLALLAVGSGAADALAYTAAHPDQVSRLVLDSPGAYGVDHAEAVTARATGMDAALAAFAERCAGLSCALGGDPRRALADLLGKAATGDLPLTETDIQAAIAGAIVAAKDVDRAVTAVATALADSARGNHSALAAAAEAGHRLLDSDGQLLGRCVGTVDPVGITDLRRLLTSLPQQAPLAGRAAVFDAARCNGWQIAEPPPAPGRLAVPVVTFTMPADVLRGGASAAGTTGRVQAAGNRASTTTWPGLGYSALAGSGCARTILARYVADGTPPPTGACPE